MSYHHGKTFKDEMSPMTKSENTVVVAIASECCKKWFGSRRELLHEHVVTFEFICMVGTAIEVVPPTVCVCGRLWLGSCQRC